MWNEDIVKEARKLHKQGWTKNAIAKKLNVKSGIVSRWCIKVPNKK